MPRTPPVLTNYFDQLDDPRTDGPALQHNFSDILTIALCAAVSGAEAWTEVETFGLAKEDWLRQYLALPNGIPSHDTFNRVFAALDHEAFTRSFVAWMRDLSDFSDGEFVALDGKTLRRSHDRTSDKAALQVVSAWASENHLVLGQVAVADNASEIRAIPRLLEMLAVSGCIVTIDAIGSHQGLVETITERGADYVIALKANQGQLFDEVQRHFQEQAQAGFDVYETRERGHGRQERRRYVMAEIEQEETFATRRLLWQGLRSIGLVEAQRRVGEQESFERRYYISSLGADARQLAKAVRGHWGIENQVHSVLDVVFDEDQSRIRKGEGAANFAVLRRMALNLLRQEKRPKMSLNRKRLRAGWDNAYLAKVMQIQEPT